MGRIDLWDLGVQINLVKNWPTRTCWKNNNRFDFQQDSVITPCKLIKIIIPNQKAPFSHSLIFIFSNFAKQIHKISISLPTATYSISNLLKNLLFNKIKPIFVKLYLSYYTDYYLLDSLLYNLLSSIITIISI